MNTTNNKRPAPYRRLPKAAGIAMAIAGAFAPANDAYPGLLTIATQPLGTATSNILPNVMFILDNSGSMDFQYMPDYVVDSHNPTSSTAACADTGDDHSNDGSIIDEPDACQVGDPPFMSPDFNTIYYNPAIFYRPAMTYDGHTEKPNQDRATTTNWTLVRTDEYNVDNHDQLGNVLTNKNLATGYPDRVFCKSQGDTATGANCLQNTSYQFPNDTYRYGETSGGSVKRISTAPYYYRIETAQYCRDSGLTDCASGSAVDPDSSTGHKFQAVEKCTDTELTDCAVGPAQTDDHKFSGVRWCSDANTLLNCQRKKIGNFVYAKHLGAPGNLLVPVAATKNTGIIDITGVNSAGGTISNITINGINVISSAINVGTGRTNAQVEAQIAAAIASFSGTSGYTAVTTGGNSVTVTQVTAGATGDGAVINLVTSTIPSVPASVIVTLSSTPSGLQTVTSIKAGTSGSNMLCTPTTSLGFGNEVFVSKTDGSVRASKGLDASNERSSMLDAFVARINACNVAAGYTATRIDSDKFKVIAPLSLGDTINGTSLIITGSSFVSAKAFSGALNSSFLSHPDPMTMGGGTDETTVAGAPVRKGIGKFVRRDIVAATTSYARASTRTDCQGSTCTYDEEMTNFANWYTYYRTRLKMMKTAAGRAFANVDATYRVGFITINPGTSASAGVSSTRYLKIDDFKIGVGEQKSLWYDKFYAQGTSGRTPLREALSRVGWIFAGKLGSDLTTGLSAAAGDDPVTQSCQPNFAILSTDGYWNEGEGKTLGNSSIANQDNTDTGYSTRASGAYDGNLSGSASDSATGSSNTLADVAMYYYKTDLRTQTMSWAPGGVGWPLAIAENNVPTTNKDGNAAQHMVTFTLGLGLDGSLSYRPDYEGADEGDFHEIKQGTKDWPKVKGETPTALDDLWHAAVNGRGVFFSARDPQTLSNSLIDTLKALQQRVGAGAAAATSNLQPVAGDNFAFTAEYQTGDWIGDLKARTIDLSKGLVSAITLWSAAAQLTGTAHDERKIFTFDSTDSAGNKLKHLCWSTWSCTDGGGLTTAEEAFFSPTQLSTAFDSAQTDELSGERLLAYIRGDKSYENTGGALATDLFRRRPAMLGDIVNAQPAYVKRSPFSYVDLGFNGFKKCTEGTGTGCDSTMFPDSSKARRGTVFAASNDGMLHAFETDVNNTPYFQTKGIDTAVTADDEFSCVKSVCNVGNGEERWAYMPAMVMAKVYSLANLSYAHQYLVDGSPQVGDVCLTPCTGQGDWRTIVVGGLNAGGYGYYALDVTNPLAPKALWEFGNGSTCRAVDASGVPTPAGSYNSDCHVGLSYSNPIITKRKVDGKWVVLVASGYNNNINGGDGRGYLYVLDALTGAILHRFTTGVGTAAAPSGLAKLNGWTTAGQTDNTTLAVYGGDLEGNMWRFDLYDGDGVTANPNYLKVVKVATVKDSLGNTQPITVRPELGLYAGKRIIMFGTGQFLQNADKSSTAKQTIYALRDEETVDPGTGVALISNVRVSTVVRPRSFAAYAADATIRTVASGTAPNWSTEYGWLLDLPDSGERVNVDPQLQLGTLVVASNVPSTIACTAGGYSWVNFLDYATGSYIPGATDNMASTKMASSLTVGINVIMLPGGKVETIVTTADNQQLTRDTPVPSALFTGRRVSWRELFKE